MAEYIVTNVVVNKDMNLVCLTVLYRLGGLQYNHDIQYICRVTKTVFCYSY